MDQYKVILNFLKQMNLNFIHNTFANKLLNIILLFSLIFSVQYFNYIYIHLNVFNLLLLKKIIYGY